MLTLTLTAADAASSTTSSSRRTDVAVAALRTLALYACLIPEALAGECLDLIAELKERAAQASVLYDQMLASYFACPV